MSESRFLIPRNAPARSRTCFATTVLCLTTTFVSFIGGCQSRPPNDSEYPSPIEQLTAHQGRLDPLVAAQRRGRQVYEHYCQICHGPQAQGNGFNAAMLDPPPRNFADPDFWKKDNDDRLLRAIQHGGPAVGKSVLMPGWGRTLDGSQIRDVIAYLHTVVRGTKNGDSQG